MGWLSRLLASGHDAHGEITEEADSLPGAFTCTTCGRTDLPEAGGWDPPICQECDAAINEDALNEAGVYDDC